ncbi:MAG: lipid A export permease/ATP-binding protein MsbA [Proteobacteria bacterium]|nr:lipid A export permease/ATP-binding protein MsbA [Pseudomonadota bacterium]MBU2226838.1 lipid A export permease/ATP-binding protein MsbA [Pseudomonadota bacterium]MBU2262103.1 lipid A export permease/ATP-binding protein MsbA [Pseudomonadota bacterium]
MIHLNIFKRLLKLAKPHAFKFSLAMLCMLVVGATTSALAFLVKPALDEIFLKKNSEMLKWIPLAVIAIYLTKGACNYAQTVLMNFIGQRIIADLRAELYRKIQTQSLAFFTKNPTGILMSRITNDVGYIQGAVSEAVTALLKDSFTLVGLVFVIFYRDWGLAIIAMFVFPLAVYPIAKFGQKMRQIAIRTQVTLGSLTTLLQETISGTRIVKAFSMEEYENRRFSGENERLFRLNLKAVSINAISSPFMEFLGGMGISAIIFYGGYQVIQGQSTPGTFFSFLTALIMLYEPVKRLTNVNNTIQQGIAGAQRVFGIIDLVPEIQNAPGASPLPPILREIEIRNVDFRYEETPVLRNIHLTIRAGEVVAFVGMSGGGKTTLVNLIPRFYDVTEGAILIDGRDIRTVTVESLRGQIAIVTQQTILFNDTVRSNIAYGDIARTEEEIVAAAKAANAHAFILRLPMGYDTLIGEQGTKLSGGERQRISIARALLKDAPILILDEATSALDSEAEIEVQDALENLMKGRTTLVIAHRLSTIRNADRIVVLVNGEIREEGAHEGLLARQGEYCRLYNMQFKDNCRNGSEKTELGTT